jgi:hypothetical protein
VFEFKTPGDPYLGCGSPSSPLPAIDSADVFKWLQRVPGVYRFVSGLVQVFFTLLALLAAMMRLRRGSAQLTGSTNLLPFFPWFYSLLNRTSTKLFGVEVIPRVLMEREPSADVTGDYGAVGLAGSERGGRRSKIGDGRKHNNEFARHMEMRRKLDTSVSALGSPRVASKDGEDSPLLGSMRNDGLAGTPKGPQQKQGFSSMLRRCAKTRALSRTHALRALTHALRAEGARSSRRPRSRRTGASPRPPRRRTTLRPSSPRPS